MSDWVSFFDKDNSIYVNDAHRRAHARLVGGDIAPYIRSPNDVVLDYGCGEAFYAGRIADICGRLILCEAAPHLRAALQTRFADNEKITALSPDEAALLPNGSINLVILHSVAQYLTPEELDALLARFRRLLCPDGLLVLGDIVRPGISALTDAVALLGFASANGFFFAALWGLVRTLLSDYWRLRQKSGLVRYDEEAMLDKLQAVGFSARRAENNIGHNQMRMTFVAKPR